MPTRKKQRRPRRSPRGSRRVAAAQPLDDVVSSTYFGLTPKQNTALMALLNGDTNTEAAHAAGVHRNTLLRWRDEDRYFSAALEFGQAWLFHSRMDQLRAAGHTALRELLKIGTQRTVSADVRINALKFIVDKCAVLDRESPPAPPSAVSIDTLWEITRQNRSLPDSDRVGFRKRLQAAIAASPIGRELMEVEESLNQLLTSGKSFPRRKLKELKQRREQIQLELGRLMRLAPEHGRTGHFVSKEAVELAKSLESGQSGGAPLLDAKSKLQELNRRAMEVATANIEQLIARQEKRLSLAGDKQGPEPDEGACVRTHERFDFGGSKPE